MYYGGESNVPGAPGNLFAGRNVNPLQDPRFRIKGGESPYRQPVLPQERSPEEDIPFLLPGQSQLPQAGIPGSSNLPAAVGNMAGIANSTFFEGPQSAQPGSVENLGAEAGRAFGSPSVRFDPNQLAVPPGPGVMQRPGYTPFRLEQGRDRFILHDPRSGVAGVGAPPTGFQGKYVS